MGWHRTVEDKLLVGVHRPVVALVHLLDTFHGCLAGAILLGAVSAQDAALVARWLITVIRLEARVS